MSYSPTDDELGPNDLRAEPCAGCGNPTFVGVFVEAEAELLTYVIQHLGPEAKDHIGADQQFLFGPSPDNPDDLLIFLPACSDCAERSPFAVEPEDLDGEVPLINYEAIGRWTVVPPLP